MNKRPIEEYLKLLLLITVIGAFLSVLFKLYTEASRIQLGSFEYVRKGEGKLSKGKFRESIACFEKAYESSPENNAIISTLANAYSKYGAYLAESGHYDKAIRCLVRARDIRTCSNTMQGLAIMYSKKAVAEARKDPAGSRADFENARAAAADSAIASKNLSIALFNNAVEEFNAGRDDLAVMLLKESSLTYINNPALELLGDIYCKNAEFEKARFYYGKALALEMQNEETRSKLRKAVRELALARRAESKSFAHFELRHEKGLPVDADSMKDLLEKCYFDVGGDLKYFPDSKTVILLYSQDDFRNIFKLSRETRAFYDGSIHMPLPRRSMSKERFSDYLYHEYTHAAVSAKTNNNCPIWLSEGLAMREEYRNREPFISRVFSNLINETQLSISPLYTAFDPKGRSKKRMTAYYLLSYSVVKYIIDSWGMEGMRNLLVRMKDKRHIANAIEDEFLLSEKEFEKRWQNYVAKRYLSGQD